MTADHLTAAFTQPTSPFKDDPVDTGGRHDHSVPAQRNRSTRSPTTSYGPQQLI